jgi:hypothetical protein
MTEAEWLACTDPEKMLAYLKGRATDRKFRLLLAAWWRRRFGKLRSFKAYQKKLVQAEEMADGNWKPKRGEAGWIGHQKNPHHRAVWSVKLLAELRGKGHVSLGMQAGLLRDIVGNPFRPASVSPAWRTPQVVALAQAAYDQRALPSGHLDIARLAVLADALEDAGCDNAELLGHLRGEGPHVRGCWAVDLLMGRS